jgi:hypothetical protein
MKMFNKAIDQDIKLQLEEIKRTGDLAKLKGNLLANTYAELKDLRAATLATRKIMLQSLVAKVSGLKKIAGDRKQLPDKVKEQIAGLKPLAEQFNRLYQTALTAKKGNWEKAKRILPDSLRSMFDNNYTDDKLAEILTTIIGTAIQTGVLSDQDKAGVRGLIPRPGDTPEEIEKKRIEFNNFIIGKARGLADPNSYPADVYDRRPIESLRDLRTVEPPQPRASQKIGR